MLLLLAVLLGSTAVDAQSKQRVGVLGVHATRGSGYIDYVVNLITEDVLSLGRFDVVERSAIDTVLREQRFQLSGAIDEATAVRVGKILGIDIGIMGSIESLTSSYRDGMHSAEAVILVKLVDMQTGRLISTIRVQERGSGNSSQEAQRRALEAGFGERFQNRLASVFRFRASVLEVQNPGTRNETIYFTLGDRDGVKVGSKFEVQRSEVTSLAGIELGEDDHFMRTIATIRVTDTSAQFARARVVKKTEPIMEGDVVTEIVPKLPSADLLQVLIQGLALVFIIWYAISVDD